MQPIRRVMGVVLSLCLVIGLIAPAPAQAQSLQAEAVASYKIEAELKPDSKEVHGKETISYRNLSPDTLNEVWLRLYLKAFSGPDTIWMQESGGSHRANSATDWGDISVSKLTSDGVDLLTTSVQTDTLLRLQLAQPLEPQQTLELEVEWVSKFPRVFARTGYGGRDENDDSFFMIGQWYPKMAVYENGRWDTEPWHSNAEFFHDFGDYEVDISAPADYVIAGAGVPVGQSTNPDGTLRHSFRSTSVTDYAFAASPHFLTKTAISKHGTEVVLYYLPEHEFAVDEYMRAGVGSVESFSDWFGAYPHERLSIIDVPDDASGAGGMEYPTLVTGGYAQAGVEGMVAYVTSHEIAHQWWPMQTATNEAREPWLDEGLTEYSGQRFMMEAGFKVGTIGLSTPAIDLARSQYAFDTDHPVDLPSWEYEDASYGTIVYSKSALALQTLENIVGSEQFLAAMATYLERYRFKHPTRAEFQATLEEEIDQDISWFFSDLIEGSGLIDYGVQQLDGGNSTVVERIGDVRAPVEIRVTLADGTIHNEQWDGQEKQLELGYAAPISTIEVDPDFKLVAELDITNNSTSSSVMPSVSLGARIAFWIQTLIQLLGLFG
jgi:hypothetical protein